MCARGGGGLLAGRRGEFAGGLLAPRRPAPPGQERGPLGPWPWPGSGVGGSCPLAPQTRLRGQGPPPPQPGRLHWPTVGATVPFHRPRMLRPGIQDLPGPGQAQRCPPFWGAVLRPWRFWVSHLLALQSWRHRESCPWSGSTRYWAQISVMRAAETNSHAPPPRSLLEHPQAQGCVTSPTSPLWDPPGALRVRGRECAQIKPLPTAPGYPPTQLSRAGTLAPIRRGAD